MKLELNRPLVFFDLETTGVNVATDKIIEIAVIKLHPDGSREEKCRRVNPGIPIPPQATAIHGITNEDVAHEPDFARLAKGLFTFFEGCDLAGYNCLRFDVPLLVREFAECGIEFPTDEIHILDAQRIYHIKEPRDLTAAYRFYCDKSLEDAHSAAADTLATLEVLLAQLEKYEELGTRLPDIVSLYSDPAKVDLDGRLRRNSKGEIVFAFGKHSGKAVKDELDYAVWMMKEQFPPDTKRHLRKILVQNGRMDF